MIDAQTLLLAGRRRGRTMVVLLVLVCVATPSMGGPIPSKAGETREAALATVESFLAREEVAQALAATGLSGDEVEQRVARLSAEDLSALAANVDQIQAGGLSTRDWITIALIGGAGVIMMIAIIMLGNDLADEFS